MEDFGQLGRTGVLGGWFYGISCIPQSTTGSVISGNKIFQLQDHRQKKNSTPMLGFYGYIGIPSTHGTGALNVMNNMIRGSSSNNTQDVGLTYNGGKGDALFVLSQGNTVLSVGVPRTMDNKTTLVTGF